MARGAAGVYARLVGARIRADWQYRLSFSLIVAGQVAATVLDLLAIVIIFSRVPTVAGWSFDEVLFLYGTSAVAFGLSDLGFSPVGKAAIHIKQGSFDRLLIRPLGTLPQLACDDFQLRRVGKLLQPAVILVVAITRLDVDWTVPRATAVALLIASGTAIFCALWVLAGSIAFWTVETQEVANSFTYGGSFITQYPLDVMTGWLRRVVVLVPLAFVNYLPATWVLDRPEAVGLPAWGRLLSPVIAVALAAAATATWRAGIRRYRSTGS